MKRLRGKSAGEKLTPRQFCNDWILADSATRQNVVVRPTAVRLDPEDFALFNDTDPSSTGSFWREWELRPDGMFTRKAVAR